MLLRLSVEERASVEEASRGARRVLEWRRLRALCPGFARRRDRSISLLPSNRSVARREGRPA
jgi:hypothetical protein